MYGLAVILAARAGWSGGTRPKSSLGAEGGRASLWWGLFLRSLPAEELYSAETGHSAHHARACIPAIPLAHNWLLGSSKLMEDIKLRVQLAMESTALGSSLAQNCFFVANFRGDSECTANLGDLRE